ncbi:MAG: histidinol dehydrogenase, partial [Verrucomicrobiales bacterium]|nr:histidinol dehydrogenase [Verrucomicrobiales bacterium]
MRIIRHTQKNFASAIAKLNRRATPPAGVEKIVSNVLANVEKNGDKALLELTKKFDGADFKSAGKLRVTDAELAAAEKSVDSKTKRAIAASQKNVIAFAKKSLRKNWSGKNAQGALVGEMYQPFERVGIYVPGGTAPLVSTSNMTVCLAAAAGCPEIVVTTPPGKDGTLNPALLYALKTAGATEIYKLGGAQAIAALGFGTRTIEPVLKVYGPGNSFVVEAKRQMFGVMAVDLLPGPSEVVVLADSSGKAEFIAADMLAQAEHGPDSVMGFITDSEKLLDDVQTAVRRQIKTLSRQDQLKG